MNPTKPIVTRKGRLLWMRERKGPRGGREVLYTARHARESEPNAYALWTETQREATDERANPFGYQFR